MDKIISDPNNISIIIGLTMSAIFFAIYSYKKTYSFWSSRGINGPTPLPFFGNSLTYIFNSVTDTDISNRKKYGKMYGVYEGPNPVLIVNDPVVIEKIFITDHNNFKYHINLEPKDPLTANQILYKRGDDLKRIRSVFTSGMTQSKLKNYFDMIDITELIRYINEHANKDINVSSIMTLHLLNVVTRIFYGIDLDLFKNQDHKMVTAARNIFAYYNALPMFISNHLPILSYVYSSPSAEANKYTADLVTYAISERKKLLEGGNIKGKKSNDFLQQMMNADISDIERLANSVILTGAAFDKPR